MCFDFGILNFGSAVVRVENNQYHLAIADGQDSSREHKAEDSRQLDSLPSAIANGTEYYREVVLLFSKRKPLRSVLHTFAARNSTSIRCCFHFTRHRFGNSFIKN